MTHSAVRWVVLGIVPIGEVVAPDRASAEVQAVKRFGATHELAGVQSAASRTIEKEARAARRQRGART